MMTPCDLDPHTLSAWFDGEAGVRGHLVEAHLRDCQLCPPRLAQMRRVQGALVGALDKSTKGTEPLVALLRIREHTARRAARPIPARILHTLADAWLFKRPAFAGIAAVLALALIGLGLRHGIDLSSPDEPTGVVVQSLQVESNATTHVTESPDGRSTLIWVDPPAETPHAHP